MTLDPWELVHEASCPLHRSMLDVLKRDREWFETHPDATSYVRSATTDELYYTSLLLDGVWSSDSHSRQMIVKVRVVLLGARARARQLLDIVTIDTDGVES